MITTPLTNGYFSEFRFLVSVPVKVYYRSYDEDPVAAAFDRAASEYDTAERQLKKRFKEILGKDAKKLTIEEAEFDEFDLEDYRKSRAYFIVTVKGSSRLLAPVIRKMGDSLHLKAKEL